MGHFHGFSFAVKDQKPQKIADLKSSINEAVFTSPATGHLTSILTIGCEAALTIPRKTFTKSELEITEAFLGTVWHKMGRLVIPEEQLAVILNGDALINKILFHYPPWVKVRTSCALHTSK
jgi:hypothetical protein